MVDAKDAARRFPDGIGERNVRPVAAWRTHASALGLVIFGSVVLAALTGLPGHERTWTAEADGARLAVHTSEVIRNGEFFEMRIRVKASAEIGELVIGVTDGIWQDMTVNSMIPAPADEQNLDGETRFTFSGLEAGSELLWKIDLQVNPDIVGGNGGQVTVYDGDEKLGATEIGITVLP